MLLHTAYNKAITFVCDKYACVKRLLRDDPVDGRGLDIVLCYDHLCFELERSFANWKLEKVAIDIGIMCLPEFVHRPHVSYVGDVAWDKDWSVNGLSDPCLHTFVVLF